MSLRMMISRSRMIARSLYTISCHPKMPPYLALSITVSQSRGESGVSRPSGGPMNARLEPLVGCFRAVNQAVQSGHEEIWVGIQWANMRCACNNETRAIIKYTQLSFCVSNFAISYAFLRVSFSIGKYRSGHSVCQEPQR